MRGIFLFVAALSLSVPAYAGDGRTYNGIWLGDGGPTAKTSLSFPGGPLVEYCYLDRCFDFTEANRDDFGFETGGATWTFLRTGPDTIMGTYTSPKGAVFTSEYVAE